MKHIILAILMMTGASAFAAGDIGPAGCGLGHMFFGGKDSQVLAATTNGSSYSQLFGITSGTSNCVDSSGTAKLESFIEGNKQAFATEAARGQGETVASVAQILKCLDPSAMAETLKSNHSEIFNSDDSAQISTNVRRVLNEQKVTCIRG